MTVTVQADEMQRVLNEVFLEYSFPKNKSATLASVHTESTLYGVNSHGIDRVAKFIKYIELGLVKIDAEAARAETFGSIERWDGHSGPGILNALTCTDRAIALAKDYGMGLVALRNTNHWMRGGTYGWRMAEAGCIGILFTNTTHNMPAWGGRDPRTGNNPLIVAIPRAGGHVVLDMALSQFSFGGLNAHRLRGEELPFPGGWDAQGELSTTPADIIASERALPIGYWKGSALSMVLDMLATLLSAGSSTYRIGQRGHETDVSQVFLCLDPARFPNPELQTQLLEEIIDYNHSGPPLREGQRTYYPGERALANFQRNSKIGMQVSEQVWQEVLALSTGGKHT